MKYLNRIQSFSALSIVLLFFILSSCKKEYETIKKPYNEIKRFALAGYADLDSLHATIVGNEIVVNWSATAVMPEKIKPVIRVSTGAVIAPVSGTEVDFKAGTSYTVTAEDGTQRVYKLKINTMQAIPKLLAVSPTTGITWVESLVLNLTGEYFLTGGDASAIKVYLQRKKDGVEVDLPLVETLLRQTTMRVNMPTYSAACDTGWHKVWLKVGTQASQGVDIYIGMPRLRNTTNNASFAQKGQTVAIGQNVKIDYNLTDNYAGAITRFYAGKFSSVIIRVRKGNASSTIEIPTVRTTNNEINFTIPQSVSIYAGYEITEVSAYVPSPIPTAPSSMDLFTLNLTGTQTFIQ